MIYQVVDWAVTYIECLVMLASIILISGKKLEGSKYTVILCLAALGNAFLVAFLNSIRAFSFATPMISIVYLLSVSFFLSKGTLILRAASCITVSFIVLAIGYIWIIFVCLLHGGDFEKAFLVFMTPGPRRCLYLALDKTSDVVLYLIFRKHLYRLSTLKKRWLVSLLIGSVFAYGVTQYLMNAILSHDVHMMRQASIVSFLVLLLFFLIFSLLLLTVASRDQERAQRLVLQQTDRLMEKNYQMLYQDLQENAKRIHDFHHHLRVILNFAEQTEDQQTQNYVQDLLQISYRDVRLCNSGNDIIDAVINCSAAEAARSQIDFHYEVNLSSTLSQISPIDLCAVLGNQVENALDACKKIPDVQDRFIQVSICQNKSFVVIQVTNSAHQNPFTADGRLVTNKEEPEFHGLGLKSIQDTVDKYNGYLTNSYEDHQFQSEALLCFSTI
ncbi:MAG TPA: sensor histidine kinase [Candidatus Scybalocola faecipullorum]|nr:sensor histidine kinase [Candidatus Scybalocola faecipullorum]